MQQSTDLDLDEIESRLYSQVFHSTENWDQTPNHLVLNKVPERQVTTYSINNQVNTARYWDAKTQLTSPSSNENVANNSTVTTKTIENNLPLTSDKDKELQNVNNKNTSKQLGLVEEYICLESSNSQNQNEYIPHEDNIDFSKDDIHFQPNFFSNAQDKLIQQIEMTETVNQYFIDAGPNHLNNNACISNECVDSLNPFIDLINKIRTLEQENTKASRTKARKQRHKLKMKQVKYERRVKRFFKEQAKEEKRLRKLGLAPNNNAQPFSFVKKINDLERKSTNYKNFIYDKYLTKSKNQSTLVEEIEINENTKNTRELIDITDDPFVISTDSDSNSDEVIEVPLPKQEIVCIDSSSENSDTDDTHHIDNNIVEENKTNNLPSSPKTTYSIIEENTISDSCTLENTNNMETNEKNSESQLKSDSETINDTNRKQILNSEENKDEEPKVMEVIEENATTFSEIEEKINKPQVSEKTNTTSISEIENERAELLCTPDSNTNDFMAHDVCNLNKTNFSFNFNLHDSDLDLSGKELSKSGHSITDVYETESSCSEAGITTKNQSYFNETDFESPIKEIFAEPDLAKFSSFITPIRNRNITNVTDSINDLTPTKTKTGTSKSKLIENKNIQNSCSDEYNSDPTTLTVKKKIKKKKKKSKKNDTVEVNNDDKIQTELDNIEVPNNTELNDKSKKVKKKKKTTADEESNQENILSKQTDSITEKSIKMKEKKAKKKNKRKSDQMENELNVDLSNKKIKNTTSTASTSKKNIEESLPETVSESIKELKLADKNYKKVESYFADDIFYEELEKKNNEEISVKDNSCNEINTIDIVNSNSNVNIEKNQDKVENLKICETEIIDISSDSEIEKISQQNEESTSSNSGNNIVINIFSPEKMKNENSKENMVTNPFSFVQNFEKLNHKKNFKDFWTNDMNKFYNESWGHEDYDITAVHLSMPSDFSKWPINSADQISLKGKKRGPLCLRCREYGHIQYRCPKPHEAIKCTTCGDNEHITTRCPKAICTTCRRTTQHHTTSCNNCSNYKTIRCQICHYIGHLPRDCPDLWRRYHLTTKDNNSLIVSSQMLKPPNMLWCSNCANSGHSANNCNYFRTEHFPTYPGIQSYNPVYNNVSSVLVHPEPEIPVNIDETVNLSQIRQYRNGLVESNNKKYLNMIKNLRRQINKCDGDLNLNYRLKYLQNAASNNRFNKKKIGELYKISKIIRNSR